MDYIETYGTADSVEVIVSTAITTNTNSNHFTPSMKLSLLAANSRRADRVAVQAERTSHQRVRS